MSRDSDLSGLSGAALTALDASGTGWLQILHGPLVAELGRENAVGETPERDGLRPWRAPVVTAPLIVTEVDAGSIADVSRWLRKFYPDSLDVTLHRTSADDSQLETRIALNALEREPIGDVAVTVYLPALDENDNVRTFAGMMQLTRRLRAPGGCPWDREQTHQSLKPHLLEETYEVLDALDSGDPGAIAEEFGDLLYQITIHSQVAAEAGEFTIEDVIQNIVVKLIGRHPHVFGDTQLETAQDVRHAWEALKQRQKPKRTSVFEGIPRGLPALPQSNLMQKRAAGVGFEWPSVDEVLAKVEEEISELRAEAEGSHDRQREELGDILFALVSVARHLRVDPEEALRLANGKFSSRFQFVEQSVKGEGKTLRDLSAAELDDYWNKAKIAATD